jgi:hypothetical protein
MRWRVLFIGCVYIEPREKKKKKKKRKAFILFFKLCMRQNVVRTNTRLHLVKLACGDKQGTSSVSHLTLSLPKT